MNPQLPRPFDEEAYAVEEQIHSQISRLVEQNVASIVPQESAFTLLHGGRWILGAERATPESELARHSVEEVVALESIANRDLSIIPGFVDSVAKGLFSQFKKMMYTQLGKAADTVGNTVDARGFASLAEAFYETIRRVQFQVDRNGVVRFPELHVHPDVANKVLGELRQQPPEFSRKVRVVQASQKIDALERELTRLRKFDLPTEESEP